MSSSPPPPQLDKLKPDDPRVEHRTVEINGHNWHYLLACPDSSSSVVATVILVHGWPDLSFGWRYQVPFLRGLLGGGLRVVVPDMLGYGRTDAPDAVEEYSMKKIAGALAKLAEHVAGKGEKVILGGHDWGGAVVWKTTIWHPHLVRAVFSVCTPYVPPRDTYMALEDVVKVLPNFRYQLQLAGPDVEAAIVGRAKLRQFLCAMYSGRTPSGESGFTTADGVLFRNLDAIGPSPLITPEETDFYADEYARHGMHGPLNWYRTTRVNFEEEKVLLDEGPARTRISAPSLMVTASADSALPPSMAAAMDRYFDDLTKGEVQAGHWALWQAPEEVNRHVGEFLTRVLEGGCEQASRL